MANPYIQNFINSRQQLRSGSESQNGCGQQAYGDSLIQENTLPVVQKADLKESRKRGFLKTNIKPENPKGYIVKENALQAAGSSITGLAKTGVYFVKALNGKGTDYTVGRINDGARFLGSLGIAAALASTAKNPKAKMMEFVGFATWFASMSLWPKMLGTTIKATKGVDINQQYVDSYGRKKGFFEDAQYITWDLYKDKDLYKMGDKLGVPKNIENRKDAIKEKAKQVATQGNTLMMLTAGFATPIATALICNTLENPVSKAIERYQIYKAGKGLEKLSTVGLMPGSEKGLEQLGKIIGTGETVKLDIEKSRQVRDLFKQFEGTGIGIGVEKELNKYASPVINLDQKAKDGFRKAVALDDEAITGIVFKNRKPETIARHKKWIDKVIGEGVGKIKNALNIAPEEFDGYFKHLTDTTNLNQDGREVFGITSGRVRNKLIGLKLRKDPEKAKELVKALNNAADKNVLAEVPKHASISAPRKVLEDILKFAHDFKERKIVADLLKKATIGDIADSQTANHWENAPRQIVKALGMDEKTIKLIAGDPFNSTKYIEQHLKELAKPGNETKLNKAVEELAKVAKEVIGSERKSAAKLLNAWRKIGHIIRKSGMGSPALDAVKKEAVKSEITDILTKVMNTEYCFYNPIYILDGLKSNISDKAKKARRHAGIDNRVNKFEEFGLNGKKFKKLHEELHSSLTSLLQGDKHKAIRIRINSFYKKIGKSLGNLDGANRNFLAAEGGIAQNRSVWAKVVNNFDTFIRDAATGHGIKNNWLKSVLFVAVPVVSVSLLAISRFGKKNKYNTDVYVEKGSK